MPPAPERKLDTHSKYTEEWPGVLLTAPSKSMVAQKMGARSVLGTRKGYCRIRPGVKMKCGPLPKPTRPWRLNFLTVRTWTIRSVRNLCVLFCITWYW